VLYLGGAAAAAGAFSARALPAWAYPRGRVGDADAFVARLTACEHVAQIVISLFCLVDVLSAADQGGLPGAACAFWLGPHLAMAAKLIATQLPVRKVVLPELARAAVCLTLSFAVIAARHPGGLAPSVAASLAARAAAATLLSLLAVAACHSRLFHRRYVARELGYCPRALVPCVDGLARWVEGVCAWALPSGEPLLDFPVVLGITAGVAAACAATGETRVLRVANAANGACGVAALVTLASKAQGSSASLLSLQRRLGLADAAAAHAALCARLAGALSEAHVLLIAAEELHALFPGACAQAVASLAPDGDADCDAEDGGGASACVAALRVDATSEATRVALHAALPKTVALCTPPAAAPAGGADADDDVPEPQTPPLSGSGTSVLLVCTQAASRGSIVTDSADWPRGVAAFSDWKAASAAAGDGAIGQIITASLMSSVGTHALGFVVLAFKHAGGSVGAHEALRAFCETVGVAVQSRRAKDAAEATARSLSSATMLARDVLPAHMMGALEARIKRRGLLAATVGASTVQQQGATSEVETLRSLMEAHPSVTVLYINIVGFSALAAESTAEQTLVLLDALWQRFDSLVHAHGAFKVHTADNRYQCVSGMYPPRPDHARAALRLALEMHAAAASIDDGGGEARLRIRIGMHCGAITSGIVGSMRAHLCVFGDAVRIAHKVSEHTRSDIQTCTMLTHRRCALLRCHRRR
jgi:class 3 adenylate cyclase